MLPRNKTACSTARDLKAIFTEFDRTKPQWTMALIDNLGGTGRSEEGLLKWLFADSGLTREDIAFLVCELAMEGLISDFFVDDAAINLISWGTLAKPCDRLLELNRQRRVEAENKERMRGSTLGPRLVRSRHG